MICETDLETPQKPKRQAKRMRKQLKLHGYEQNKGIIKNHFLYIYSLWHF